LVSGVLLLGSAVRAQDSLHLNLKQAVTLALASHPDVVAGKFDLRQQEMRATAARNAMLPQVNAFAGVKDDFRIPMSAAPDGNGDLIYSYAEARFQASAGLQIDQPLFDLARWSGPAEADARSQVSRLDLARLREATAVTLADAWCRAWIQERVVELAQERVVQAETLETVARAQWDAGSAQKSELLRIQVRLSNLRGDLANARRGRDQSLDRLALLVGDSSGRPVALDGSPEDVAPRTGETDRISDRSDWKLLEGQERLAARSLQRARMEGLPVLSLQARGDEVTCSQRAGGLGGRWDEDATLGLRLDVPIFDGFDRRTRIAEQRLRLEEIVWKRRHLELEARRDVEGARQDLATSEQILEIQGRNLRLATEALRETQVQFQAGTASLSDLLEAEGSVVEARHQNLDALGRRFMSILTLRRACGSLLADLGT
jgi:outer membrane protein TolC